MSEEITLGDPDATILVLHDPGLDPLPFIRRLIRGAEKVNGATSSAGGEARGDAGATAHPAALEPGSSSTGTDSPAVATTAVAGAGASDDDDGLVPWTISNKYYTAPVCFRPHSLDRPLPDPHPVIMYVWSGSPPDPLPAALTRLSVADPPPDISLAVRLGHGRTRDADEERFAELGLDVVDEAGASDDDERHIVRQTLMTHMWPTMERRPAGRHAAGPEARLGAAMASLASGDAAHAFPVTFSDERAPPRAAGPASDFPTPEAAGYGAVPQDPSDAAADDSDDDDFGDFAAGAGQPGAEEYARLDEWLDGDEQPMPVVRGEAAEAEAGAHEVETPATDEYGHSDTAPQANGHGNSPAADTFEDDFGPPPDADTSSLPLDPTPILLHLQHVRAELADLDDEDERRVRAGVEVARLMRSLGMGDDDLGLEDLEFDEVGAGLDAELGGI